MIIESLIDLLRNDADILNALGDTNIYFHSAPSAALMPWITLNLSPGGQRRRLTTTFVEPRNIISAEIASDDEIQVLEIGRLVVTALDFYRGNMTYVDDAYLRCGTPHVLDGYSGAYRCIVEITARYKERISYPSPV